MRYKERSAEERAKRLEESKQIQEIQEKSEKLSRIIKLENWEEGVDEMHSAVLS